MTPFETANVPVSVDLQFVLRGEQVPSDHADELWHALLALLPWLGDDEAVGIHPLSGLSPGVGQRYLSRRARLTLRLPRVRVADAGVLAGAMITLGGYPLEIGPYVSRELGHAPVLHAKCVTYCAPGDTEASSDEARFFNACQQELADLGMRPQLICGKLRGLSTVAGILQGFSLLVAGLDPADTLRLQQCGLGRERRRGCGIFVPHKSMAAVGQLE